MAARRARLPPEVVQYIISETSERGALFNFLTVNHVWFPEAARVLWRQIELRHLWNLPLDRRQFYANWVENIKISGEYYTRKDGISTARQLWRIENRDRILNFPNLKHLDIFVLDDVPDEVLAQYFVPTLRVLHRRGKLSEGLMNTIAARCRNLDEIWMYDFEGDAAVGAVEAFVRNCHTRMFTFYTSYDSLIGVLAIKKDLEELELPYFGDMNLQQLIQKRQTHERMFERLTSFTCFDISVPVNEVLCNMPQLRSVELTVPDLDSALKYLSTRRPLLESASVNSYTRCSILPALNSFVGQHRTLKELSLAFVGQEDEYCYEELNNSWIHETTSVLPLLEKLSIEIQCCVSGEGMIHVGLNCPLLKEIVITIRVHGIKQLANNALSKHKNPVFKNLIWLEPSEIFEGISRGLLEKHFPICHDFIYDDSTEED